MSGGTTTRESEHTAGALATALAGAQGAVRWEGARDARSIVIDAGAMAERRVRDIALCAELAARALAEAEDRENLGAEAQTTIEIAHAQDPEQPGRWLGVVGSRWHAHEAGEAATERAEQASADEAWAVMQTLNASVGSFRPLESPAGADSAPLYAVGALDGRRVRAVSAFEVDAAEAAKAGLRHIAKSAKAAPARRGSNGQARRGRSGGGGRQR